MHALFSRLGKVGSISIPVDCWEAWESKEKIVDFVAKIASLSYGNTEAKNPQQLFERIVRLGHLSCLEFVPIGGFGALPLSSLRSKVKTIKDFDKLELIDTKGKEPCFAFLVECPIFVARQWMRHRSFSYLELSRRYTKGAKVNFDFYGGRHDYMDYAIKMYQEFLEEGKPPELARICLPLSTITKFWVAGYKRDWESFIELRETGHAQDEIRVFAQKIKELLNVTKP